MGTLENALLMPTDEMIQQRLNVAMAMSAQPQQQQQQQPGVHCDEQPDEKDVVSQLNIRQRVSHGGVIGDVSLAQMKDLELRQHCTTQQHQYDLKDDEPDDLAKFFSDNENITLMETSETLPEWDSEDLENILSSVESCDDMLQPIGVKSYESCMQGDSVCEDGEQKLSLEDQPFMLSFVVPAQSSTAVDSAMMTSSLTLYSPSPHASNNAQSTAAAVHGPLSPTGVAGTMLQQLAIDSGAAAMDLAISGTTGQTIIRYVPATTQVYCVLMLGFLEPSCFAQISYVALFMGFFCLLSQ